MYVYELFVNRHSFRVLFVWEAYMSSVGIQWMNDLDWWPNRYRAPQHCCFPHTGYHLVHYQIVICYTIIVLYSFVQKLSKGPNLWLEDWRSIWMREGEGNGHILNLYCGQFSLPVSLPVWMRKAERFFFFFWCVWMWCEMRKGEGGIQVCICATESLFYGHVCLEFKGGKYISRGNLKFFFVCFGMDDVCLFRWK